MDSNEYARLKTLADAGINDHTRAREAFEAFIRSGSKANCPLG